MEYLPDILVALGAYAIGTASPGPATLAIMRTSAAVGRREGLRFAYGVIMGSLVWGLVAAVGFTALMVKFAWLLTALKVCAGLYLLWLAYGSLRSALSEGDTSAQQVTKGHYFLQGFLLHLTNPKAVFVWSSVIALGLPAGAEAWIGFVILVLCAIVGALIFSGFAVLFSTTGATHLYARARRKIEATVAMLFAAAGIKLLLSRS